MDLTFNLQTTSLVISGLINLILAVVIGIRKNKTKDTVFFLLFSISVLGWVLSRLIFEVTEGLALYRSAQALYFCATYIPLFLLLFIGSFPRKEHSYSKRKLTFILIPPILAGLACLMPGAVINSVYLDLNAYKSITFGWAYWFYFTYIISYFMYGIIKMILKRNAATGVERNQLEVVFLSILVSSTVGMYANLILPSLGSFKFFWVGPLFSVFMVITIGYAIVRYQLFETKLITTEFLTFLLWALILLRTIYSASTQDRLINGFLFLASVIIGLYLIRNVVNEIFQREKIETLAKDLELANSHLQELDQQKSEFVSLASHQLRGPLTAIKGYASMLLDDDFGEVKDGVRDAIDKVYKSTQDLVVVVGDYLDVSRIEQGRMQYDFSEFNMKDLIATLITELRPNIERAKLSMEFDCDFTDTFTVYGDQGKIKQVIGNILDNSIKYCPQGGVHIWLTHNKITNKILITISDTGVGIHPDVLPRLFEKFTRAPDASKTNIMGTGLGLYVARKMIEAHHGKIWAESAGQGKGSSFFIELDSSKEA
jgi:signal transduction histidine kinase